MKRFSILNRSLLVSAAALCLLLLAGCGDDRPYTGPPDTPPNYGASPAPAALAQNSAPDGSGPDALTADQPASDQPVQTADPLLSGADALSPGGEKSSDDPFVKSDPLAQSDPLKGPSMPTEHSHWLNTEANEAKVSVLLNGMRLSSFQPSGTQDITMKLHPGPNTLTVIYTPQNAHSWGSVTLTEGEHEGQAILLAQFQKAPLDDLVVADSSTDLKPTTQTFTFFAK